MKRILSYILLLALLGGTSIWAYNNVKDEVDNIKQEKDCWAFGRRRSDDKDGPLTTTAWTEVDVDFKGEAWYIRRYGIQYEGYAKAKADWGWDTSGYYSISASADNRYPLYEGREWFGWSNRSIADRHFVDYNDNQLDELKEFTKADIQSMLNNSGCEGHASIDQYSGSGSGANYAEYQSVAEAD